MARSADADVVAEPATVTRRRMVSWPRVSWPVVSRVSWPKPTVDMVEGRPVVQLRVPREYSEMLTQHDEVEVRIIVDEG